MDFPRKSAVVEESALLKLTWSDVSLETPKATREPPTNSLHTTSVFPAPYLANLGRHHPFRGDPVKTNMEHHGTPWNFGRLLSSSKAIPLQRPFLQAAPHKGRAPPWGNGRNGGGSPASHEHRHLGLRNVLARSEPGSVRSDARMSD